MIENCKSKKRLQKFKFYATITLLQTLRGRREIKELITSQKKKKEVLTIGRIVYCVMFQQTDNKDILKIGQLGDCVTFQKLRRQNIWALGRLCYVSKTKKY